MTTTIILRGWALLLMSGPPGNINLVADELLCPGLLVRGQVTKVNTSGGAHSMDVKVVGVFAGPNSLAGKSFALKTNTTGQKHAGAAILRSAPTVASNGIFIVRLEKDHLVFDHAHTILGAIELPVMQNDPDGAYERATAWAQKVKELLATSPPLRMSALRNALLDSSPEISTWAMEVYGQTAANDSPNLLDELVGESQLPLAAQLVLDKYLCQARAVVWLDTPVRIKMMESWVGSRSPSEQNLQRLVLARFAQAANGQMPGRITLKFVQKAIENPNISESLKPAYLTLLTRYRKELATSDEAFDFLAQQIVAATSEELAISAALTLKELCQLDSRRRVATERLMNQSKRQKVKEILSQALRNS